MIKTATAINTFLPEQKDNFELPQEQQLITLSISDYKSIFIQIEKLNNRIAALESHISALDAHQSEDMDHLARSIAEDRQRITKLEEPTIQPEQERNGYILRSLIAGNGGKMLAKDARAKLKMDKGNFSRLLDLMKNDIGAKRLSTDRRNLLLFIK